MTTETQLIAILRLGLWGALCWLLCFWLVRDYRLSMFRQRLFEVRDALFDAAVEGVVPFNHPAYGMARQFINGLIRFAHRLNTTTFISIMLVAWLYRSSSKMPAFSVRLQEQCKTLPTQEARERVMAVYHQALYLVFAHLTYASPIFLPLFLVVLVYVLAHAGWFRMRQTVRQFASRAPGMQVIEREAEIYGTLG